MKSQYETPVYYNEYFNIQLYRGKHLPIIKLTQAFSYLQKPEYYHRVTILIF